MFNFDDFLSLLFITNTSILLLVIILFVIHRRNNKKRLHLLEEKLHELSHDINQEQNKQFDTFKQGLQQLINDLSKRLKSNEHRIADIINQIDETQAESARNEYKIKATELSEKDLTKETEA